MLAARVTPVHDSDDAPRALRSQFFCRDDGTPKAAITPTLDCGVYCNGITRRHLEDHFYGPRVHRSLVPPSFLSRRPISFTKRTTDSSGHPRSNRCDADTFGMGHGRLVDRRQARRSSVERTVLPLHQHSDCQATAGLFCDSQTLDCGVYCRGITGRRDEDQLYGLRLRRFLDGAVISFNMPNFAHDDDYEFVQDFRDSRDDVTPLECAPLFSLTTATLAVCPRKLSSSQSIRIRFSASTTDARYRETSSARHTAIVRDVHDVHDDDFRGIATDLVREYKFILIE
ncbi:hypothetical protein EDD18DRAFT_1219758 [Armillaria luteobubalina]|uniref:Uncharacterized protein n=1 Tax=Armillaria luteobubalina TaxID=153913 RepID=A0AA39NZE3_9AGAR|nr:hypothetical protein EDD18DRAFT_1219758 [Armillaria luteobubalina]